MRTEGVVQARGRTFHVAGTVRGLLSEADRVRGIFAKVQPSSLALGVGPEDLDGISHVSAGSVYEHDFSEADEVYAHYLTTFGPVELPPKDLLAAVEEARSRGLPVVPIDLAEEDYVDTFTKAVTGWQLLRYNRRVRKLAKRPPAAQDALGFHLGWDREIRRLKGFDDLERTREGAMAAKLLAEDWPAGTVLVLLEAARVEGVLRGLEAVTSAGQHT